MVVMGLHEWINLVIEKWKERMTAQEWLDVETNGMIETTRTEIVESAYRCNSEWRTPPNAESLAITIFAGYVRRQRILDAAGRGDVEAVARIWNEMQPTEKEGLYDIYDSLMMLRPRSN